MKPSDGMLVSRSNYIRGTERCYHWQGWSKVLSSDEYARHTFVCPASSSAELRTHYLRGYHENPWEHWFRLTSPKTEFIIMPMFQSQSTFHLYFLHLGFSLNQCCQHTSMCSGQSLITVWDTVFFFGLLHRSTWSWKLPSNITHFFWPLLFLQWFSCYLMPLTSPPHKCWKSYYSN